MSLFDLLVLCIVFFFAAVLFGKKGNRFLAFINWSLAIAIIIIILQLLFG